ncbi:MAG: hypothetical protein ACI9CE_002662 [Flavobacterium sp.]|jgi:hypothetical protein
MLVYEFDKENLNEENLNANIRSGLIFVFALVTFYGFPMLLEHQI